MSYRIQKNLDNPLRAMGIPIDLWLVFILISGIGILFNHGLLGILLGFIGAIIFGKYRTRAIIRKIARFMYWYLPSEFSFIKGVKGHHRKLKMRLNSDKSKQ